MGIVSGGGYAERIAVHERQLVPVPPAVAVADARGHPRGVHHGVGRAGRAGRAHVRPHRARARRRVGCRHGGDPDREGDRRPHRRHDVAPARSRRVGRSAPTSSSTTRSEDFVAAAREFTGGRGVDVVLDVIGGDYLERNLDALATQGTIVQVGAMGGGAATFTLGEMLTSEPR